MRRIVCAANKIGADIILGARHWDWLMHEHASLVTREGEHLDCTTHRDWEQGFIDQHGVFLTREEAWVVAEAAGQIIRRVGGDGKKLFSENLY